MKTNGKITVEYIRSNEIEDVFAVNGAKVDENENPVTEYIKTLRSANYSEQDILELVIARYT